MPLGLAVVIAWMAFVFLVGLAMMWWGISSGQFDDIEEPAHRMMDDREPQAWAVPASRRRRWSHD